MGKWLFGNLNVRYHFEWSEILFRHLDAETTHDKLETGEGTKPYKRFHILI